MAMILIIPAYLVIQDMIKHHQEEYKQSKRKMEEEEAHMIN